jgi:glycosyltransferase involved in cell wall biosynthesis
VFHGIPLEIPKGSTAWWKDWYPTLRKEVILKISEETSSLQPVGLHHPNPGSFRILPAYHSLGIPYTLGPLGGGEVAPFSFLRSANLPLKQLGIESLRPMINRGCVSHPWSHPVLKGARHVLATTEESAKVCRAGGARSVSCAFPDVFEAASTNDPLIRRPAQQQELKDNLRLIFSGRSLWWKGGTIVLEVLAEARKRGIKATLTMITEGPVSDAWQARAESMGLTPWIEWSRFVPREDLLQKLGESHVYIYPTLHDSSSSALPEAYSTGLPSMTLGIGGAGTASGEGTGFNEFRPTAPEWVSAVVDLLQRWQAYPEEWLECSRKALERSNDFSQGAIEEIVERELVPIFYDR